MRSSEQCLPITTIAAFDAHGRNVAANLVRHLDRDRAHVNARLPDLEDRGLLEKIEPAPNAGLYELTSCGRAVLAHRERYVGLSHDEFDTLVEER